MTRLNPMPPNSGTMVVLPNLDEDNIDAPDLIDVSLTEFSWVD